jgi:hypothetical protein
MFTIVVGAPRVFDAALSRPSGRFVKVFGSYANEWGYASRPVGVTRLVG